jgi:CDP-glycerol glycerophosphotransferase (TagB/SpsB family)
MAAAFRSAGLIYGPELHHLDHLGPLCSILEIPLLVTEEKIAELAKRYYPGLQVVLCDYLGAAEYLVGHFDIVFYSMPRDLFDEVFFFAQKMAQKRVHTIWCPHGNSDKGNAIFYMEALKKEEAALVYGKQMIEFFQRKNVYDQLKGHVITGNFRYEYYLANRPFYDGIAEKQISKRLARGEKTLLYAPTWQDYERSSSFFDAAAPLIDKLPENHNLIVKLHPNLILQEEFKVEELMEKYEERQNVLFLTDFAPVYPLLNLADVYIGDMSSIGYDFLVFDRPMFFLNQNERDVQDDAGLYLFRCGIEIKREQYGDVHKLIENYFLYELRDFSSIRKEVYALAFGHRRPLDEVKREVQHLYGVFKGGLDFF